MFAYTVVGLAQNSTRLSSLDPDTDYLVSIRALDTNGNASQYSTEVEIATLHDLIPPAVPENLTSVSGIRSISVLWSANTEFDFKEYELHASQTSGYTPSAGTRVHTGFGTFVFTCNR